MEFPDWVQVKVKIQKKSFINNFFPFSVIKFESQRPVHFLVVSEQETIFLGYDYTVRYIIPIVCISATLLCEFENDKIWINDFK